MELAKEATRFDGLQLAPDTARKLMLLKLAPAPAARAQRPEAQRSWPSIAAGARGDVRQGQVLPGADGNGETASTSASITKIMAESRNYDELLDAWSGLAHHLAADAPEVRALRRAGQRRARGRSASRTSARCGAPLRHAARRVRGRRWSGCGTRSSRSTTSCTATCARSWRKQYGEDKVPADGPIPAHLLGNMWAQEWGNIYPLVEPPERGRPGYDLTALLKAQEVDAKEMVSYGERFFTSLGLEPLPQTFWERSLFMQAEGPRRGLPRQRVGRRRRQTCASRCASRSTRRTSSPSTTSSATTSTSTPTTSCRCSSATAPTTASTRPSATRSRSPSRRRT